MHIGAFSAPHRAKFRFPFDPTKVRHFFQIRKDLGNYFSSISLTEVSEVKMEVKIEVNSLRSWELKWTIPYEQTASKAIVQPARLALLPF